MIKTSIQSSTLIVLLWTVNECYGYPADKKSTAAALSPFHLTYTPAHVFRHITRNVTLRCAHDMNGESRLHDILRIRMLKKSRDEWTLVAEQREKEDEPRKNLNVTVSGVLGKDARDTFLEITWEIASNETFGTYRCDVIGFEKDGTTFSLEITSEVSVFEENVTANDFLDVLKEFRKELSSVEDNMNKQSDMMTSLGFNYKDVNKELGDQKVDLLNIRRNIDALYSMIGSVTKNVTSLTENVNTFSNETNTVRQTVKSIDREMRELKDKVKRLDEDMSSANNSATSLAKEISDIKGDFAFFVGEIGSLEHTVDSMAKELRSLEKKVGDLNGKIIDPHSLAKKDQTEPRNKDPDTFRAFLENFTRLTDWPLGQFALLKPREGCPWDLTFTGKGRAYLKVPSSPSHSKIYRFCEASGAFNTRLWPDGSYCVNKLYGFSCPNGLQYGHVLLSNTDSKSYFGPGLICTPNSLEFCCKNSGSFGAPMALPTHSDFMLYRHGGRCQEVQGMKVSNRGVFIDIVHNTTSDINTGIIPDVDIHGSSLMFNVCLYIQS